MREFGIYAVWWISLSFGIPEEKRKNEAEAIYKEIASENFSKWIKDIKSQIQKSLHNTRQDNTHTQPSRHIKIKLQKIKEREKYPNYSWRK